MKNEWLNRKCNWADIINIVEITSTLLFEAGIQHAEGADEEEVKFEAFELIYQELKKLGCPKYTEMNHEYFR